MRIILLFIIIYISSFKCSSSENLRFKVLDDKHNPVPYSHIFRNNVGIAITDSNGECSIPKNIFHFLDTIKVSFIGMETQLVIYDEDLMRSEEHLFYMKDEKMYFIDEVIISADNAEKLFRKYSNIGKPLNYNCILVSDYNLIVEQKEVQTTFEKGQLKAYNELISKEFDFTQKGWFHHLIETNIQEEKIKIYLHYCLQGSMSFLYHSIIACKRRHLGDFKPYFYYLGIEDDFRMFRVSYPQSPSGLAYQVLVYLDIKTGELVQINFEGLDNESKSTIKIESNLKIFKSKKPKKGAVLIPLNLESEFIYNNIKLKLSLSNLLITPTTKIK